MVNITQFKSYCKSHLKEFGKRGVSLRLKRQSGLPAHNLPSPAHTEGGCPAGLHRAGTGASQIEETAALNGIGRSVPGFGRPGHPNQTGRREERRPAFPFFACIRRIIRRSGSPCGPSPRPACGLRWCSSPCFRCSGFRAAAYPVWDWAPWTTGGYSSC